MINSKLTKATNNSLKLLYELVFAPTELKNLVTDDLRVNNSWPVISCLAFSQRFMRTTSGVCYQLVCMCNQLPQRFA